MSAAAPEHLNAFQDQLALLLACLHDKLRLQVQWFCDSDYRAELLRYREQTERATNIWTRRCRNERFTRYWQAMLDRQASPPTARALFLARDRDLAPGDRHGCSDSYTHYDTLLPANDDRSSNNFSSCSAMSFQAARITPMKDADHYRHCATFLNPSLAERFDYDPLETFDPELSIQENCWHSEAQGLADASGFWMDGFYHSVLVLSRWPKVTHPGLVHRLTGLPLLDYTITVNIESLSARAEIAREEKAHDRLAGDYASEKRLSLLTAMEKKQKKIAALMQGHTMPFNVEYIVRAWDQTREGLATKVSAIKNAINGMNGAQYLECALPTTAKKLFSRAGRVIRGAAIRIASSMRRRAISRTCCHSALPLPAISSKAEALYEGPQRNLVGVTTFSGAGANATPQHAVLLGMSGAGKSVTVCDLLSQTEAFYDYTVIIEEGLSYEYLHAHSRTQRASDHPPAGRRPDHQLP